MYAIIMENAELKERLNRDLILITEVREMGKFL